MKVNNFIIGKLKFKNDNGNKNLDKIQKNYINEKSYFLNKSLPKKIIEKTINHDTKKNKSNDKFLQRKKERKNEEDYYTPAEKLFYEKRKIILQKKFEKLAQTSYKEKYKNYNKALTKLPQHNDIPKIGPG